MSDSAEQLVCLGCGAELTGPYCRMCGQKAQVHRTLRAFLHDLLHGVFHFEGKIWRTLGMLAIRPGELTRRYIAGERSRFVSPVGLFLFSVFAMFAVFQLDAAVSADPDDAPVMARDEGDRVVIGEQGSWFSVERTGWSWWDRGVEKMAANPSLTLYKLQANAYKFSWLLIPLSIPAVWLLFAWRRRFGPFDHAVFVTYSLSFMTLYFVLLRLVAEQGLVPWIALALAAIALPIAHIYRQLKGAYELSPLGASWRTAALAAGIPFIMLLFFTFLHVIGTLG